MPAQAACTGGGVIIIITHTLLYCRKAITSEAASANKHHHQLALNYIHTTYRNPTWFSIMSIIYRLITSLAGTWRHLNCDMVSCTSSFQYSKCIKTERDITETKLPSNLRPTRRKCASLVRRGHFRSRDEGRRRWSHHSIHCSQKSHVTNKLHDSMFYTTRVIADRNSTL